MPEEYTVMRLKMIFSVPVLAFVAVAIPLTAVHAQSLQSSAAPAKFVVRTGVNVSHWLSQSNKRGEERSAYITKADFDTIASLGFDHVRIPIDEVQMWDSSGNKEAEAFRLLHHGIQWAIENNLRVIVDLHIIRSHYFNAASNPLWTNKADQDWLVEMWRQLSDELHQYPDSMLAYEILNEAVAKDPNDWNRVLARVISEIRKKEPERVIVVGSNRWQSPGTFPELRVPADDPNIILSFHFYTPLALTHHEASWTPIAEYKGAVNYPGQIVDTSNYSALPDSAVEFMKNVANGYYDRKILEEQISPAIKVAQEKNLRLCCGEFGVYPTIPEDIALRWYSDLCSIFREHKIAFCHWNYKADFPVVNEKRDPNRKLVSILTEK